MVEEFQNIGYYTPYNFLGKLAELHDKRVVYFKKQSEVKESIDLETQYLNE
jgi:hypothetical protein